MPTLIIPMTIQGIHGTEDASEELESVLTPAQLKKLDLTGNVPAQLMTEITRGLDRMNEHKVSFFLSYHTGNCSDVMFFQSNK